MGRERLTYEMVREHSRMTYEEIKQAIWNKRQNAFIQTSKARDCKDWDAVEYWSGAASSYHEALQLVISIEEDAE